jgi:ubiquinol-cytochrome c reductase cytochrome c1 subunit
MRRLSVVIASATLLVAFSAGPAAAEEDGAAAHGAALPELHWSFDGFFGTFDRAALQRGYQVYREVCSACHGMNLLSYRNLSAIGYGEDDVKAIAASFEIPDGPDADGEMFERPGLPSDRFKAPFPNDNAARAANNGALPPDLSLITKSRRGGPNYTYALMIGYGEPPADVELADGMSYNAYFPGHQIAMPPPLTEDAVTYADGTPATVDQMARDVATFLAWAAEPELEERKRMGVKVVLFLIVLTGMLYAVKRKIWAKLH